MIVIGVTGGIGGGKSTICCELAKLCEGVVISADKIGHEVLANSAASEVTAAFGTTDRKQLGEIVFADPEKLRILNAITHKYIFKEIQNIIDKTTDSDIIILEAAVLFTTDFPPKYDYSIAVTADKDIRINRIIERDKASRDDIKDRISAQPSDDEFRAMADFVVENNGGIEEIKPQLEEILNCVTNPKN